MVNKKFDSEIQERHNENVIVGNSIGEMKIKKSTTVCGVPSLSSTLKCKNLLVSIYFCSIFNLILRSNDYICLFLDEIPKICC